MNDDNRKVFDALRRAVEHAGVPWPPPVGATPLREIVAAFPVVCDEPAGLSYVQAARHLERAGVDAPPDYWLQSSALAGLLFANAAGGYFLVNGDLPIPDRRFAIAHLLGHYLLHFDHDARAHDSGFLHADEAIDCRVWSNGLDAEANRFAFELLMPEASCRRILDEAVASCRDAPAYRSHLLASALLMSRPAAQARLQSLGAKAHSASP